MVSSVKEIYKGFKYTISQMFVVKEPEIEIEIGLPTDVKHVSHIGWDGPSGSAPTWMNGFNTGPEFAKSSIGNTGAALSPWSSLDSSESTRQKPGPEMPKAMPPSDLPPPKRKQRRKKNRQTPSSKSNPGSTSRSTRPAKSKLVEGSSTTATDIKVA